MLPLGHEVPLPRCQDQPQRADLPADRYTIADVLDAGTPITPQSLR